MFYSFSRPYLCSSSRPRLYAQELNQAHSNNVQENKGATWSEGPKAELTFEITVQPVTSISCAPLPAQHQSI
jgi:hypothetical protein